MYALLHDATGNGKRAQVRWQVRKNGSGTAGKEVEDALLLGTPCQVIYFTNRLG